MTSFTLARYICLLMLVLASCSLPTTPDEKTAINTGILPQQPMNSQVQCDPDRFDTSTESCQEDRAMLNLEQVISAQVLLVSATGRVVDGNTIITSENINAYRPSEATVRQVSQYFRASGFEISPLVGISFTISASARHFSDFFGVTLVEDSRGGIQVSLDGDTTQSELPLERLDKTVTESISSATFVPPPDFGPTSF